MRIDPKYFNLFVLIVALVAAGIIVFFSVSTDRTNQRQFRQFATSSDSLTGEYWPVVLEEDSLRIADLKGRFVLVDFWSTWSLYGDSRHRELAALANRHTGRLTVLAAAVRDRPEAIREYDTEHGYPFRYVDGTAMFTHYRVPGIPAMLLYNPAGEIQTVFVGYEGSSQIDSLEQVIQDGRR